MTADGARRVGMGLYFYPRGGSAQVARYLAEALTNAGWRVDLAVGSLGDPETMSHAATFFDRDDIVVADYSEAAADHDEGRDAMRAAFPHHASFEDRAGVPDRVFASLDDDAAQRQVAAWADLLVSTPWADDPVLHLHHLSPLHLVAQRCFPNTPCLTHLHGTELKFIATATNDPLPGWDHATAWVQRLRRAAADSSHTVCISPHDRDLALEVLGLDPDRVSVIPNGIDTERFDRRDLDVRERLAHWRRWLVDEPLGWDPSGAPGTICYTDADLGAFVDGDRPAPVLLFVGRFLAFKRVPLLVRAYRRARDEHGVRAPLVIWGGAPGEWEGEHPFAVARDERVDGVFFVGWRGHDELPTGLACADVFVAPSVDEPFGQVYLEAMGCGVPVIGTTTGGPLSFVNTAPGEPNGWLVAPDDERALAAAIAQAARDSDETRRRGEHAYRQVRATYSWRALAEQFVAIYEELMHPPAPG